MTDSLQEEGRLDRDETELLSKLRQGPIPYILDLQHFDGLVARGLASIDDSMPRHVHLTQAGRECLGGRHPHHRLPGH